MRYRYGWDRNVEYRAFLFLAHLRHRRPDADILDGELKSCGSLGSGSAKASRSQGLRSRRSHATPITSISLSPAPMAGSIRSIGTKRAIGGLFGSGSAKASRSQGLRSRRSHATPITSISL